MIKNTLIILAFQCGTSMMAQTVSWVAPADKQDKVSPFRFSDETAKKGAVIFKNNCSSCHGNPGKGDFVKLIPPPGDPATEKFQDQKDGALFFKITTGRGAMPSFKDVLTEEERWIVISYFRSFNKKYVQPEPVVMPAGKFGGMDISVKLTYLPQIKKITALVTGKKDSVVKPLESLELLLYAKRFLGELQIDEPKTTNAKGEAYFEYKDSLPGDTAGNIVFIVKLNAEGLSDLKQEKTLKAGKIMKAKSLIDTRAMWSVRSKSPIWLIALYSLVAIGVWLVLIYIVMQIVKLKKIGDKKKE
jgi:mono/diheme cytochrome c family protein